MVVKSCRATRARPKLRCRGTRAGLCPRSVHEGISNPWSGAPKLSFTGVKCPEEWLYVNGGRCKRERGVINKRVPTFGAASHSLKLPSRQLIFRAAGRSACAWCAIRPTVVCFGCAGALQRSPQWWGHAEPRKPVRDSIPRPLPRLRFPGSSPRSHWASIGCLALAGPLLQAGRGV